VYLYDRDTRVYVTLPGLNTSGSESLPALNEDGSLLSFTGVRADATDGGPDIYLYDVKKGEMISLSQGMSGVNTEYREQFSAICPGARFFAFQTDRKNPDMGMYDRDIVTVYKSSMMSVSMRGLNSDADDDAPFFSGDGNFMLFHSRRPGGEGGSDVYMYCMGTVQETPVPAGSETGDITLTKTAEGLFTVPAKSGAQTLNLLVETGLSALVLFEDKIPSGVVISTGGDVSLKLPGGGVLNGKAATADIAVGNVKAAGMRIVLAKSGDYAAAAGLSLSGADGVFGMYRKRSEGDVTGTADIPLAVLQPSVSMTEFNLDPTGVPGLSLGSMPVIAGVPANMLFNTYVQGRITDESNPEGTAFTDFEVSVTPLAVKGGEHKIGGKHVFLLSSTLKNRIILDTAAAAEFGDLSRWNDIYLFVSGSESMLRLGICPAAQVQVKDLSGTDYDGIIGLDFWQNFVLGFDTVGLAGGGPSGVVSFLNRSEIGDAGTGTSATSETRHLVALPGLNSSADDSYGDISDDGNTIVFQSSRSGNPDIYVWRKGQGLLNLAGLNSSSAADTNPRISADGNRIVFASDRTGSADVYLYDLTAGAFVDLPGLNTGYNERFPDIGADGTVLAFQLSGSPDNIDGNADIRFYSIGSKEMLPTVSGWLNTEGDELLPSLNRDGTLAAFTGMDRADTKGGYDVYLWKSTGGLADLNTRLNTADSEGAPSLSADGGFMALASDRNSPDLGHRGRDIFLFETASEEFLFLPGLNSEFEEGAPALSENAEYILFHSKRPGGEGGYDIYLYQRDTEDATPYTASETYTEDGQVSADGSAVSGATVTAVDADGRTVATATADDSGRFSVTVPAGTALPVTYKTDAQGAEVVTDEVGDDTYVPDFQAGNLSFTRVWIEDEAQTGFTTMIRFDVETTEAAYNTYIKVYLKKGNPSEIELNGGIGFTPDYDLTALVIDKLGQKGGDAAEVLKTQGDIVTKVTYLPGTENREAHVEHTFIVPSGIVDGTYTAVFAINTQDINSEDDEIQDEEIADESDNYIAAPASIIIGNPDKPNLRIVSAQLVNNSFGLDEQRPKDSAPGDTYRPEFSMNMEVESMAQDTVAPVSIKFELEADGVRYPLWVAQNDEQETLVKKERYTYTRQCLNEKGDPAAEGQEGVTCASLFRQSKIGHTYQLYLNEPAYDALAAKTADTSCKLIVTIDPEGVIQEWENNKSDNAKIFSVIFIPPESEQPEIIEEMREARKKGPYDNTYLDKSKEDSWGKDNFVAGYKVSAKMTYRTEKFGVYGWRYSIPVAANFTTENSVTGKVFDTQFKILNVDGGIDFDAYAPKDSYFEFNTKILSKKIYGKKITPLIESSGKRKDAEEKEIWNTKDKNGNQLYEKSCKFKGEKTFMFEIPFKVEGGITGTIGIRGAAFVTAAEYKLRFDGGPYADLSGYARFSVDFVLGGAGVGGKLKPAIYLEQHFQPSVQILISVPSATFKLEAPLEIQALGGRLYLFAEEYIFNNKKEWDIIKWDPAVKKEIIWMNRIGKSWSSSGLYDLSDIFEVRPYVNNESRAANFSLDPNLKYKIRVTGETESGRDILQVNASPGLNENFTFYKSFSGSLDAEYDLPSNTSWFGVVFTSDSSTTRSGPRVEILKLK